MKRVFLFILFFVMAISFILIHTVSAQDYKTTDIGVVVNGNRVITEKETVMIEGRTLMPASTVFSELDAVVEWYEKHEKIIIADSKKRIVMKLNTNQAYVNGVLKDVEIAPILYTGTVMVPVRFITEALDQKVLWDGVNRDVIIGTKVVKGANTIASPASISRSNGKKYKVVIDPGHGGRDPGAIANELIEKNVNLDIALRLEKLLIERGIDVYMTRRGDTYPELRKRASDANNYNADLFLSIHNNAGLSYYRGSMTLYYPLKTNRFSGIDFAKIVQEELVKGLGLRDLGIRPRPNLVVLRKTRMPAVIAEIAFLTNSHESNLLKTSEFKQKAALALEKGVIRSLEAKR